MTKKIIKATLSALCLFGFICSIWHMFLSIDKSKLYTDITQQSLGISGKLLPQTLTADKPNNKPYTYINIPKTADIPLALFLYQSNIGQDQPDNNNPPTVDDNEQTPSTQPNEQAVEGLFPVIALDMSEQQTANNMLCKNESKYEIDINKLSSAPYPITYTRTVSTNTENQPVVLIVHSHGTECYLPDNTNTYTAETPTRTQDTSLNVVSVGKVFADTLTEKGIPTIHCETMFDKDSYSESYNLSEKAIQEYLKSYPSIQYIFDIHRDSIMRGENEKIKPMVEINGTPTAQAMFVVGTDSGGANHPNWPKNLTVASIFQYGLISKYGNIMRPLNVRSASFNAEHAIGSVLIEIGTCGNTITEAQNCAKLLGETIGDIILNDGIK